MQKEIVYQLLTSDSYGYPVLQEWFLSRESAEEALKERQELWKDEDFSIEEGTDHIRTKCRGCKTVHSDKRHDAHGISTGDWCESCYDSDKYPYRKDKYPTIETHGYGERLSEDY